MPKQPCFHGYLNLSTPLTIPDILRVPTLQNQTLLSGSYKSAKNVRLRLKGKQDLQVKFS